MQTPRIKIAAFMLLFLRRNLSSFLQCLPQTWYLAVDMQLFILSPIVLYPLWKWPHKWNILLLGVLTIAGVASPFTISYLTELSANLLTGK
jgi:peptidoglycan/LPS O-acetylase OafA/YrhL